MVGSRGMREVIGRHKKQKTKQKKNKTKKTKKKKKKKNKHNRKPRQLCDGVKHVSQRRGLGYIEGRHRRKVVEWGKNRDSQLIRIGRRWRKKGNPLRGKKREGGGR